MSGLNSIVFQALEICREFEEAAIAGRKRWEVRRRPVPLGEPVALVVDGRLSSFALFSHGVVAMPAHLRRRVGEASGGAGAETLGVSDCWLFDYARGRDLYAYEYDGIARANLARGVNALYEGRIVNVTSTSRSALENWQGRMLNRLLKGIQAGPMAYAQEGGAE